MIRKTFFWLLLIGCFSGCSEQVEVVPEKQPEVSLVFEALRNSNATDDPDNLSTEYAIKNVSIFLTDASSATITHKYVYQSFTSLNTNSIRNCQLVNLPLDPATVSLKDIYVIANCDDSNGLNAIQTLDDLKALKTPTLIMPNILTTERGLPMYGETLGVNLGNTADTASVQLTRLCAKIRVKLLFPDAAWIGTNNQFAMENVAAYAYYVKNSYLTFPASVPVNYPMIDMIQTATQEFTNTTYIYESATAPRLHLSTVVNQTVKDYMAESNFPQPVRNYLYDIEIQILSPMSDDELNRVSSPGGSTCKTTVRISEW